MWQKPLVSVPADKLTLNESFEMLLQFPIVLSIRYVARPRDAITG